MNINMSFFLFLKYVFMYLFERERVSVGVEGQRKSITRKVHTEQGAPYGTQSQDPEIPSW